MQTLNSIILIFFFGSFLRAQGPVGAYGFNENTGTTTADASGNNNTGNVGAATWTTQGKFGNALSFNGTSSKVVINNSTSLQLNLKMTLEAWVYPTVSNNAYRDVIVKGGENYYLSACSQTTRMAGGGGHLANGSWTETYSTNPLPVNTWSHITITADGSSVRFYVNGIQTNTKLQPAPLVVTTKPLEIGGDSTYGQYFQGTIDEVRVYDRALTQAEIQTDMNTPVQAQTTISQVDKHPDDPVEIDWDYNGPLQPQPTAFILLSASNSQGPWTLESIIQPSSLRSVTFNATNKTTLYGLVTTANPIPTIPPGTVITVDAVGGLSGVVRVNCIPLKFLIWTIRSCQ